MRKSILGRIMSVIMIIIMSNSVEVKATTSITMLPNLEKYDWRTENIYFSDEIIQYMKEQYQDGNEVFVSVRGSINQDVCSEIQVYESDQESDYYCSDFYQKLSEKGYGREYYAILSVDKYDYIQSKFSNDTYGLFVYLVNHSGCIEEREILVAALWNTGQPVAIYTEKIDNQYLIVKATINEYVIQEGDTLTSISKSISKVTNQDVKIEDMVDLNQIIDKNSIRVGDVLIFQ